MSFKVNVATWCIDLANTLIHFTKAVPTPILFSMSLLLVITWITGKKLSRFTKPEYPKISTIIREIATTVSLLSLVAIAMFFSYALIIFILAMLGFLLSNQFQGDSFFQVLSGTASQIWIVTNSSLRAILGGSVSGLILSVYLTYYQIPIWERGEGLHDVNQFVKTFKKLNGYDPTSFINIQKGCFIGLDSKNKPIYVSWQKIRETHIQVIGTTGCGKGVVMTLIAYQAVLAGEGLVWIDPKFDRFSPRILASAAKQAAKTFYLINLNPEQPPQLNPFAGAEAFEIEELLVSAFDLKGKGTDGEFHRGKDEDAAIQASRLAVEKNALSIPELIQVCRGLSK